MNGEIVNIIVNIGCTLLGTILGWFLNVLYENKVKKVKLCYSLQQSASIESNIAPEYKTKYSDSDYCIEVYNVGNTAVILEQISLRYKKRIITDCVITDEDKTIQPYGHYTYQLTMQEYDDIQWHCKNSNLKRCKVVAYDINGKRIRGSIDLILPYLQVNFRK